MAHENDWPVRTLAFPAVEQIPVNFRLFQTLVDKREEFFQQFVKTVEFLKPGVLRAGHRFALYHAGELFGIALGPDGIGRRRIDGMLDRADQGS